MEDVLAFVRSYALLMASFSGIILLMYFLLNLLHLRLPQERVTGVFQRRGPILSYGLGAAVGAATPF
ncbi:MAG: hypothetical protein HYX93_04760 [Chloroflexi bacterium]|nr:hypothetical protein [Chloroflexota bacterium]